MSQYNLKKEVDPNNQNLNGISPRLTSALEKLHAVIDELKTKKDLSNFLSQDNSGMEDKIEKLNNENIDLLHKLEDLKQKNSKLKDANKEVESRISKMITTYRNFLR